MTSQTARTLPADYFDVRAGEYDARFTDRLCARWLRDHVHTCTDAVLAPDATMLEIGCGTGADALRHAARGCSVVASDLSEHMLACVERRRTESPAGDRVTCVRWDANQPPPAAIQARAPFDAVFSNFGALNCVNMDSEFAERVGALVKPGGRLIAVVMGPICPWEVVWFGLRGRLRVAFRRLRSTADQSDGIVVRYPSIATLARSLSARFRLRSARGVGFLLPPSFAFHLVERWPRLFCSLSRLERRLAAVWPFRHLSDHYLAVFERADPELP